MGRKHLTDYGRAVKIELVKRDWTMSQLAELVSKDTGLFCNQSYLWSIFVGDRSPDRITDSINKILQMDGVSDEQRVR